MRLLEKAPLRRGFLFSGVAWLGGPKGFNSGQNGPRLGLEGRDDVINRNWARGPVQRLEPISAEEMVLVFLKAEVDSGFYGPDVVRLCQQHGWDRRLIDDGDLANEIENGRRRQLLAEWRGWGKNTMLFRDFPTDVSWHRARLSLSELGRAKYAAWPEWKRLTRLTMLVADGARNASNPYYASDVILVHVPAIAEAVRAGESLPELIFVAEPGSDELVLVEGHKRATAYLLAIDDPTEELAAIVGTSPSIARWWWRPRFELSAAALRP